MTHEPTYHAARSLPLPGGRAIAYEASSSLPRERSECGEVHRRPPVAVLKQARRRCSASAMCEATVGWGWSFCRKSPDARVVFENPHPGLRFASAFPPREGEGQERAETR